MTLEHPFVVHPVFCLWVTTNQLRLIDDGAGGGGQDRVVVGGGIGVHADDVLDQLGNLGNEDSSVVLQQGSAEPGGGLAAVL